MPDQTKIPIAHVITTLELGGAQKHALSLIGRLDPEKYERHFICGAEGQLRAEAERLQGVRVTVVPFLKRRIAPCSDLRAFFFLVGYFIKYRIRLVHTHSSKAGLLGRWAAWCCGVPGIFHTVHGWSFHAYMPALYRQGCIILEKISARITRRLIVVSRSDEQKGLAARIGSAVCYRRVRCAIDPPAPPDAELLLREKAALQIPAGAAVITMIACLKPQKNPLDFARVAARVRRECPETFFLSVGDGILKDSLAAALRREGVASVCKLLGWQTDISAVLALTDVVVLTSLWEGLPLVLVEAMACAKPVVAYAVDGIPEIVQNALNGYAVEPRAVDEMAERIVRLVRNPSERRAMGSAGREFVERECFLQPRTMTRAIESIYALPRR
ncbi:MAG: glycosyltransferase family 4 protein [Candidatus Omnitrophica bacterium]|nr:glycosyltransferase family 4 protein [Candidatus Omnitrophota bacterium]